MLNSCITPWNPDGKTWILVLTGFVAEAAITKTSIADRLRGEAHVVVQKLAPLHQHVGTVFIHCHMVSGHQEGRHQSGTWEMVAIVHSGSIPSWKKMKFFFFKNFNSYAQNVPHCCYLICYQYSKSFNPVLSY